MRTTAFALAAVSLLLAGCAIKGPPPAIDSVAPDRWYTPVPAAGAGEALPHGGSIAGLSQWWRQQNDPLLAQLIDAAQAVSPTIAASRSRIEDARAARVASGAALLPQVDAAATLNRTRLLPGAPLTTITQGGLQASWEIDLFGAGRNARDAAQARLAGAEAGWHDARVAVAAEVANQYYDLRSCEILLTIARSDAASRSETSRLTQLAAEAGFQAPATAALARASAAEASSRTAQQQAQCELNIKSLVALTALSEPDLRKRLGEGSPELPQQASIAVPALPAQVLAQRPDIFNAQQEVAAASADVGGADAQRYPRLALTGFIGAVRYGAGTDAVNTWSIGPVALTLPLFDGGTRAANLDAARARYDEAATRYRAAVRLAVREVEEALVRLDSTAARTNDARAAVEGYRASFDGTESRYRTGLASLVELEEARRSRLVAETSLVLLQRERTAAWVSLYRAAGGGWQPGTPVAPAASAASATPSAGSGANPSTMSASTGKP